MTEVKRITSIQGAGLLQEPVRRALGAGKVAPEVEEERVKRILEAERKKVQPVVHTKGKRIEHNEPGKIYDAKGKLIKSEQSGKDVDIKA